MNVFVTKYCTYGVWSACVTGLQDYLTSLSSFTVFSSTAKTIAASSKNSLQRQSPFFPPLQVVWLLPKDDKPMVSTHRLAFDRCEIVSPEESVTNRTSVPCIEMIQVACVLQALHILWEVGIASPNRLGNSWARMPSWNCSCCIYKPASMTTFCLPHYQHFHHNAINRSRTVSPPRQRQASFRLSQGC